MDERVVITPNGGIQQSFLQRTQKALPLLRLWTGRELRARYRQSVLRSGWSIIQPVILLLTYGWVLVSVLDLGDTKVPYLTFAWAGLVPFTFVAQALGQAVGSIRYQGHVISKVYFPREVLPLAVVGAACVDLLITTLILVGLSWIQVGPPTIHLVALVVVDGVLVIWVSGISVLAATATVFYRDLAHAMPLILRVLFIISPVMYAASLLAERAPSLARLNPLTVIIEGTRAAAVLGTWPDWTGLAAHGGVATVLLGAALVLLRRTESLMPDKV